ncbi:MAG: glycine--tRNA ligase subunit beta [Rhodocyclaceae bacterium]|nr:MAG: glycine--tRNA ligase subunit beta [Rhodocyclaceae bacterium]
MTKNLLVELFVEELPPKALKKLGETFGREIRQGLIDRLFVKPEEKWEWFASPRRLAIRLENVESQQAPRVVTEKLLPVTVAFDREGKPTPALLKKLQSKNFSEADIPLFERRNDGKIEALFFQWTDPGFSLEQLLGDVIEDTLQKLPIPKVMTYQLSDGWTSVQFVRPAHSLIVLHGADVLEGVRTHTNQNILGLKPGRETLGHRFEAASPRVSIADADSYAATLEKDGAVIPGFATRRAEIAKQLAEAAAKAGHNLVPIHDEALLDEVTALVERPNVLIGQFEEAFLEVPQECLILTMKANQKYFPLLDASVGNEGKLTNKFLIVSNIRPADPSNVIGGNERVVRPRLADAKFFFDQDRKKKLEDRVAGLDKVVYHNKLGTQGERVKRVAAIACDLGFRIDGETVAKQAEQAAKLAKADLLTDMVGEFPELQGIMGRYYALHDKLDVNVADAIEDHYKPRFAGDDLPRGKAGVAVALADKMETLCGMFSIGQIPTGDKDPFALRRHALGVIRMLIENDLPIELDVLLNDVAKVIALDSGTREAINQFIYDRLAGSLRDQGYSAQEVDAVVSQRPQRLGDIPKRLAAVRAFAALPEAAALAAANKRVGNILKKVEGEVAAKIDAGLLQESAEQALAAALAEVKPKADAAFDKGDYTASLQALAALRGPVDTFFNDVMVNAEDAKLRNNRLGLLATLHAAMNRVADLSKLSA